MRSARRSSLVVVGLAGTTLGTAPASCADSGPVIVVPRRARGAGADHCVDVTGAVIEGEFGLYEPQMVDPRVILRRRLMWRHASLRAATTRESYGDGTFFTAFGHPRSRAITRCRSRRRAIAAPGRPTSEQVPADLERPAPPLLVAPQI